MRARQPIHGQDAAPMGRKGLIQVRASYTRVRLLLTSLALGFFASGCNRYEYEVRDKDLESGKITSLQLGQVFLRYGQRNNDPLAIVSAVNILEKSRSGEGTQFAEELKNLLDQALDMDDGLTEIVGKVRETLKNEPSGTRPRWLGNPTPLDDVNVAKLVLAYGKSQQDPLAVISGCMVLARFPAGDGNKTRKELADEWHAFKSQLSAEPIWIRLGDQVVRRLAEKFRGTETPDPQDWPTFLGPRSDGTAGPIGNGNWQSQEVKVNLAWHTKVGSGYGMCSIRHFQTTDQEGNDYEGDSLFQFDRHGDQLRLACLDAATGMPSEVFKPFEYTTNFVDSRSYNGGPRCSPVVDGDRVYIYGPEGILHCVNALTGVLVWGPVDTARKYNVVPNQFGVGSTPLVLDDKLIVVVGGSDAEYQNYPPERLHEVKGNGSAIVALDKMTGEERYRIGHHLASYASPQKATINNQQWCFAFVRDGLIGFRPDVIDSLLKDKRVEPAKLSDADSQAQHRYFFFQPWQALDRQAVTASTPVVVKEQGQVFISMAYNKGSSLLQVTPDGFDVIWSDGPTDEEKKMAMHFSTPIHHDGYLYGSSGEGANDAELRCIKWKSGEWNKDWSKNVSNSDQSQPGESKPADDRKLGWSQPGLGRISLLYLDEHFICLTEYGKLLLVKANAEKFERVEEFEKKVDAALRKAEGKDLPPGFTPPSLLKYPCWTAPALSRGRLYIRGSDRLVCLELSVQPPE